MSTDSAEEERSAEEYFVGYTDNLTEAEKISKYLEEDRSTALASKVSRLEEASKRRVCDCLFKGDIIARSLKDLRPAGVTARPFFELKDSIPNHNRPTRIAPRKTNFSGRKLTICWKLGI